MRRIILTAAVCLAVLASCSRPAATDLEPAPYGVYSEGLIGRIHTEGWIREFLDRQSSGLSGHPEAMCYPYNTCLWDGEITRERGKHGSDWWRYEQTAYYSDGLLRLGYLTDNREFIDKVEKGIRYTLAHTDTNGIYGLRWSMEKEDGDEADYVFWPQAVYFRAIQAYYEKTGDDSILPVLENHFLSIPQEYLRRARNAINIEGLLWTYAHTGNPDLLERAVKTWEDGEFWLRDSLRLTEERLYQHGVTCCEQLKLPVLLYTYTGDRRYLDYALAIERRLEDEDLLPDGVISSAEYLCGKAANHSHETCDIADYSWTLGYFLMATGEAKWGDMIERAAFNACPGAVGKDFRTLQYFSSVNQFICTGHSNNNDFCKGRTWMQYRPVHQVECCVGNVHRIMPNYAARMWMMSGKDSPVAALFGPSSTSVVLSDGSECTICEETAYPFSDDIQFVFKFDRPGRHNMTFSFRIPEWADDIVVTRNGAPANFEVSPGGFASIEDSFSSSDTVCLRFVTGIEVKDLEGQGCYVQRGPLLFTYAIPEECSEDFEQYNYIHGKVSGNPEFKPWNKVPAAKWNYALKGVSAEDLKLEWTGSDAYPFDKPACIVRVPVVEVEGWTLDEGVYTPANPTKVTVSPDAPEEHIDLMPYGTSYLRLTVFPVAE